MWVFLWLSQVDGQSQNIVCELCTMTGQVSLMPRPSPSHKEKVWCLLSDISYLCQLSSLDFVSHREAYANYFITTNQCNRPTSCKHWYCWLSTTKKSLSGHQTLGEVCMGTRHGLGELVQYYIAWRHGLCQSRNLASFPGSPWAMTKSTFCISHAGGEPGNEANETSSVG